MKKLRVASCFLNKYLSLSILILLFIACNNTTPKTSSHKKNLNYTTADEFTKQGKTIPEKLEETGFTKHTLIYYYHLGNTKYYVFSDWRTKERGDVVTWVVVDGEVKDYFKDEDGGREAREI